MPPHWHAEVVEHAQVMIRYIAAHTESSLVLKEDPTWRDKLYQELTQSTNPNVRRDLVLNPDEDILSLLRGWDEALARTPLSFEEFPFSTPHLRSDRVDYYEHYVISPAVQKYGTEFRHFYSVELNSQFTAFMNTIMPTPSDLVQPLQPAPTLSTPLTRPSGPPIGLDSARALLGAPHTLLGLSFHTWEEGCEEHGMVWRVVSVNVKRTAAGVSTLYEIMLEGELMEVEEAEVLHRLSDSYTA
ncbi:hypothetical protein B0H16DRAFT_1713411 [Mycena metata]|uniref:Uncharacterized protein n=1 Tax=Mycena metata TaxID=1033252 RepID=A0AAD7JZE2_9AGAR|nr:hypothetical protein B0H16DRAFT_1713411 [Mycena metata]